jgi:ribosomal protein S18 acetylase RimI-like enzyme
MNVRQAVADDGEAIRSVARASLEASYGFLDEGTVEGAVERWYSADALAEALADPDVVFLLVEDDDGVVAFSESVLVHRDDSTTGELDWLHVRPEARYGGVGSRLLERTEQALVEMGADRIQGLVLSGNEEGASFYADNGYSEIGRRDVEIDGESFEEVIYRRAETPGETTDITLTETTETEDGATVYLAEDEAERGTEAPFVPVYRGADRTGRYGFFCTNCHSLDVAMDSMGGAECAVCGNTRRPTRWDAVYL